MLYANATYPFYKNKMGKRSFFLSYKKKKKRDDFLLPKSSLFFLKPWMNKQNTRDFLFVHPSTKKNSLTVVATLFSLNALNSPTSS
ncbi:hypothetical protein FNJ56_12820 [Lactococcus lactis]|nr:hypothetical protein FNJ56_12820 [Lactococcus lactis]